MLFPSVYLLLLDADNDDWLTDAWEAWSFTYKVTKPNAVGGFGSFRPNRSGFYPNYYTNLARFHYVAQVNEFLRIVNVVADAAYIDTVHICDCGVIMYESDATEIGDNWVCSDCIDNNYRDCHSCGYTTHYDNLTSITGWMYCNDCRDNNYSWCDECEAYYHDDDDHDHGCDCEAPHRKFTFPVINGEPLPNNERLTVELPKGEISEQGMVAIARKIYDYFGADDADAIRRLIPAEILGDRNDVLVVQWYYISGPGNWIELRKLVDSVGTTWQTKRGNFTRRLSSAFYKKYKFKLPNEIISNIGNLAQQHSSDESEWLIEFTRDLNQSAEAFGNEGSCWWESYFASRCALKNWGGLGLRSYDDDGTPSYCPTGRAWVQPLDKDLNPTHNTDAFAYIVYNGYDDLDGYMPARLIAQLTGKTYCKLGHFRADSQYVNGNVGYLVADEATCTNTDSLTIGYDTKVHHQFDANHLPTTTKIEAA